jgi:anti-sigma B factor antagonist
MEERIAVIGLGYVGLPIALAFARKFKDTVGFDVKESRVESATCGPTFNTGACKARNGMNHTLVRDGTATALRVRGVLDALSCPELRPVLDLLAGLENGDITVDLSELRLIDSSGVGALVMLYKRVRANGGLVKFVGVTAQPLVIFKLLRLDRALELS